MFLILRAAHTPFLLAFFFLAVQTAHAQPDKVAPDLVIEDDRIGMVQGLALDTKKNIYVGDLLNRTIHRYDSTGQYDRSFGRSGQGPGEFQSIAGTQVGPGDSLYVYDRDARRLTVFPTGSASEVRTYRIPPGPRGKSPSNTGEYVTGIDGLWVTAEGDPLIAYGQHYIPGQFEEARFLELHFIDSSQSGTPILRVPDRQMVIVDNSIGSMPFGNKPVIELDRTRNRLYYGYTNELIIMSRPLGGSEDTVVAHDTPRIPLDERLLRNELERQDRDILLQFFDDVKEQTPAYVPAFEDFTVDRQRRIWVSVNTPEALEKGYTEYWVFDSEDARMQKVIFDRIVFLQSFTAHSAYGLATRPSGLQHVVRYELDALLP